MEAPPASEDRGPKKVSLSLACACRGRLFTGIKSTLEAGKHRRGLVGCYITRDMRFARVGHLIFGLGGGRGLDLGPEGWRGTCVDRLRV